MLFASVIYILRADNKATWNLHNLAVGQYPVFAVYNGNANYERVNAIATFNVEKYDTAVTATAENITLGENATITVEVSPDDARGNVTVEIDGKNYTATVKDGKATLTIPDLT